MCSILKNLSYLFFYLYFVNAFTVGFANQNAMESILQRIRSADRLQPGFQDPIRRIVELHQSQTNLEEKETEESNEETNNVNKEKLNKELQRIEDLKKTVLEKLKLSSPPNISTTEKIPINSPVMRALFKQYGIDRSRIVNDDDDDDEIKSQKLVSTAKSPPFNASNKAGNWFYFDFAPEERENFRVKSANIWFYVRNTTSTRSSATIQLDVVRSYQNDTDGETSYTSQRHSVKHLNLSDSKHTGTWKHFPVTNIVSNWLSNPSSNYGIKLFSKQMKNLVANGINIDEQGYKPFLEIQLVADHHRRKRHADSSCEETADGRKACCVEDLTVNFHDIGWDWIIYPSSYNAKFCRGECFSEATDRIHTQIVHQAQQDILISRSAQIGRVNQSRTCCVPTKFQVLSLLYYDNQGNVVYSDIPDMEIKKCGCL